MILSLFWTGLTEKGAIASMIVGFLGVPFFKFVVPKIEGIGPYFAEIAELGPAFLCAMLAAFVVSKIWPDEELRVQAKADLAHLN